MLLFVVLPDVRSSVEGVEEKAGGGLSPLGKPREVGTVDSAAHHCLEAAKGELTPERPLALEEGVYRREGGDPEPIKLPRKKEECWLTEFVELANDLVCGELVEELTPPAIFVLEATVEVDAGCPVATIDAVPDVANTIRQFRHPAGQSPFSHGFVSDLPGEGFLLGLDPVTIVLEVGLVVIAVSIQVATDTEAITFIVHAEDLGEVHLGDQSPTGSGEKEPS